MITLRRVVTGVLVLAALSAFVFAFTIGPGNTDIAVTGDVVERLVPAQGSQALRQTEVGIDLAPEWTAVLIVNGTEIPEDQLRRVEAQNEVYFQPGEGKDIEAFEPGTIIVEAEIWRTASETRDDARTVTWRFGVA